VYNKAASWEWEEGGYGRIQISVGKGGQNAGEKELQTPVKKRRKRRRRRGKKGGVCNKKRSCGVHFKEKWRSTNI